MQPNPTAPESDDAGERTASTRKNNTSKRKIIHNVPDPLSERWMDKQEVLELLHISESTLQKWRKNGLLPFSRILGKIYYKESDILQLLEKCKKAKRA
jgi:predicted DNA-binding transcriptional regulator AlpA